MCKGLKFTKVIDGRGIDKDEVKIQIRVEREQRELRRDQI
jgi:hypothetical protein